MGSRNILEWTCDVCAKTEAEKLGNWRVVSCGPVPAPPPQTTEEMMAAATPGVDTVNAVVCSKPCRTKWVAALDKAP